MTRLYLDELEAGAQYTSETLEITEADIKRFAGEFDPQPFHLDDAAARQSLFGGLAASGWHTAAVTMRLMAGGGVPLADGIIGLGGEIAWPRPTRPGDRLQVVSTVTEIRHSKSKPGQGIVTVTSETFNQSGEIVQRLVAKLVVYTRAQSAAEADRRAASSAAPDAAQ
jgi:acyl dehydratase